MNSTYKHIAMRYLNTLKMLLLKNITTVNHSNSNLSVMIIDATKQQSTLEQKLRR